VKMASPLRFTNRLEETKEVPSDFEHTLPSDHSEVSLDTNGLDSPQRVNNSPCALIGSNLESSIDKDSPFGLCFKQAIMTAPMNRSGTIKVKKNKFVPGGAKLKKRNTMMHDELSPAKSKRPTSKLSKKVVSDIIKV